MLHFIIYHMLPGSGNSPSFVPTLIRGLEMLDHPKLAPIEDVIVGEIYFNLWALLQLSIDGNEVVDAFRSLPLRLGKGSNYSKRSIVFLI